MPRVCLTIFYGIMSGTLIAAIAINLDIDSWFTLLIFLCALITGWGLVTSQIKFLNRREQGVYVFTHLAFCAVCLTTIVAAAIVHTYGVISREWFLAFFGILCVLMTGSISFIGRLLEEMKES